MMFPKPQRFFSFFDDSFLEPPFPDDFFEDFGVSGIFGGNFGLQESLLVGLLSFLASNVTESLLGDDPGDLPR